MSNQINVTKPYHFFTSSYMHWTTGTSIDDVVRKQRQRDRKQRSISYIKNPESFSLWFVPLPPDADYTIDEYAPQVEGAVFLGRHYYDSKKDLEAKKSFWNKQEQRSKQA